MLRRQMDGKTINASGTNSAEQAGNVIPGGLRGRARRVSSRGNRAAGPLDHQQSLNRRQCQWCWGAAALIGWAPLVAWVWGAL